MLELLLASSIGVHPAPECPVRLEMRVEDSRRILRPRPACPIGFDSTREAVRALLAHAGPDTQVHLHMGRIVDYPWLSALLERAGGGTTNTAVAKTIQATPELGHLFPGWSIASVSVEKVLVRNRKPYDAILWITLVRKAA
jgi:hypothetical protein